MRAASGLVPVVLLLCGCSITIGPTGGSCGGEMSGCTCDRADGRIDYRIVRLTSGDDTTLVIVADGVSGGSVGSAGKGDFLTLDGRRLEWEYDSRDGRAGTLTLCGARHDLAKGGLILISARHGKTWVRQASADVARFKGQVDLDTVRGAVKNDVETVQFLEMVGRPKPEPREP